MTIHRPDRPNAPARVRKAALRPDTWIWRCMDAATHHGHGFPSWSDAFKAMEKHRLQYHLGVEVTGDFLADLASLRALARSHEVTA